MKLLLDMNLSPKWVGFLTAAGFDAVHWSAIGAVNALDADIMRHARERGCVVVTCELDFGTILAVTHGKLPSVVQLRSDDLSHESIGKPVVDALHQLREEIEHGALVTIDPGRTRLRILPLNTTTRE